MENQLPEIFESNNLAERNLNIKNDGAYNGSANAAEIPHALRADALSHRDQGMHGSTPTATPILLHADPFGNFESSPKCTLPC
jgi:hypothetical protein